MFCIHAALCEFTGSPETLVFHTLSAGNIGQLDAPGTVVPARAPTAGEAGADECEADCDVGEAPCSAAMPGVAAAWPGLGAADVLAPPEQPALAAAIAMSAAVALDRQARMGKRGASGITVASWHGPAESSGDPENLPGQTGAGAGPP